MISIDYLDRYTSIVFRLFWFGWGGGNLELTGYLIPNICLSGWVITAFCLLCCTYSLALAGMVLYDYNIFFWFQHCFRDRGSRIGALHRILTSAWVEGILKPGLCRAWKP